MTVKFDARYVLCPICKSNEIIHFHSDFRGNEIYKCKQCSVQFMNPVYSAAYLEEFYSVYIMLEYTAKYLDEQRETCKDVFSAIRKFKNHAGEMFDFGLGNGGHSSYAKENGWHVTGYDVDCTTTARIAKEKDIKIFCGDIEQVDLRNEQFDLIYAHHVVEHLKDPVTVLLSLRKLLKSDGIFYIGVPNIASLATRLKFGMEKLGIRRNHVGKYYDSDHHVIYYTPESLKNMLVTAGFEVVLTSSATKPRPYQNKLFKLIRKFFFEKLYAGTAFFVIARKI